MAGRSEGAYWVAGAVLLLQLPSLRRRVRGGARLLLQALDAARRRLRAVRAGPPRECDANGGPSSDRALGEQLVARRICQVRLELFNLFVACSAVLVCVACAWNVLREARGLPRWSSDGVDVVLMVFIAFVNLLNVCPCLVSSASVPWWGSCLACCLTAGASHLTCPPDAAPYVDAWMLLPRVLLYAVVFSWQFTLFWSFCHFAVVSVNVAYDPPCDSHSYSRTGDSGDFLVATAMYQLVLTVVVVGVFQSHAKESVRAAINSSISQSELRAANSLMNLTCDAVVELDARLRVLKSANQLAVIFLASNSSAQGEELKQFFYSEGDQEAFVKFMGRVSHEADSSTQVFHLPMRDSRGNKISMEFFHVCFYHFGEIRHLLGIRELSDTVIADDPAGAHSGNQLFAEQVTLDAATVKVPRQEDKITIKFHASSFEVQECSDSFRDALGEPPKKLTDWMRASRNSEFKSVYQQAIKQFIENGEIESDEAATCALNLDMPCSSTRPERQCKATCAMKFLSRSTDRYLEFPGNVITAVEIYDLNVRTRSCLSRGTRSTTSRVSHRSQRRMLQEAAEAAGDPWRPPGQDAPAGSSPGVPGQEGGITIKFHADSFEVKDCSDSFREVFGEPPAKFTDWLRSSKSAEFEGTYRLAVERFMQHGEVESDVVAICALCLHVPRAALRPERQCRATCAITFCSTAVDRYLDFSADDVVATVEISNLSVRTRSGLDRGTSWSSASEVSRGSRRLMLQLTAEEAAEAAGEGRRTARREALGPPEASSPPPAASGRAGCPADAPGGARPSGSRGSGGWRDPPSATLTSI